jgi:signal transduction histidine kinase
VSACISGGLIDSIDDAVFALDTEGRTVDVNSYALDRFDIESDVVGRSVTEVLAEYPPLLEAIKAQQDELEITLKQHGDEQHHHVKRSPVYDTRLRLKQLQKRELQIGQTVVIRNITERKQRQKEIERQNERLDEFVGVVSHDLRSPLNVAEGRVELARNECESDHLDAAARAHERMETLIEDLMTLARSGQSIDEMEPNDLSQIAEYSWQNVETADATPVTNVDPEILADRSRLYQLVENLIRNAVEHGGEDVTIRLGTLEDGFYIADNGSGIAPDERDQVFESGYSTAEAGSGVGSRIVKQIAEAHGWDITVTDTEGGGARFELAGVTTINQ